MNFIDDEIQQNYRHLNTQAANKHLHVAIGSISVRLGSVRTWHNDKNPLELIFKLSCTIQRIVRIVHSVIYVPPMLRDVLDCGRVVDNCCCCCCCSPCCCFWI